jgi:RiboL-PSP-HEPN
MGSASLAKFDTSLLGAKALASFSGSISAASAEQEFTDQCLLCAAIAQAVGCWEGYIEGALKEFVSKTRVQAHRKAWPLIVQFESLVDKLAADFNTPNWEKSRDLILNVTGMDPFSSWIWSPRYINPSATKEFFDGILKVRHSFAHGFSVPSNIPGVVLHGKLEVAYVNDAIACLAFFAKTTDDLLDHELKHRHGCATGWI